LHHQTHPTLPLTARRLQLSVEGRWTRRVVGRRPAQAASSGQRHPGQIGSLVSVQVRFRHRGSGHRQTRLTEISV
jgi:hypothetical protein